jgi:hypothetical protein
MRQWGPRGALDLLNDIDTLLAERDALAEKLKDEEAAHLRTIDERDSFEDSVSETAALLGCREEWSNLHDHRGCIPDLIAAHDREIRRMALEEAANCISSYFDAETNRAAIRALVDTPSASATAPRKGDE